MRQIVKTENLEFVDPEKKENLKEKRQFHVKFIIREEENVQNNESKVEYYDSLLRTI